VKGVFFVKNKEKIIGKNVLLVDDVFTTGATMEEAARVLKETGAKKIVGIVVAKASPDQDKLT
jgi:competence protein ComFC